MDMCGVVCGVNRLDHSTLPNLVPAQGGWWCEGRDPGEGEGGPPDHLVPLQSQRQSRFSRHVDERPASSLEK